MSASEPLPEQGEDLLERVEATGLLAPGRPVVVLLSGGRDSTCLLDLAVALAGPAVSALHVNYGLRGASSEGDEEACRVLCADLGVALEVHRATPPASGNVQVWAREARYGAGAEAARAAGGVLAAGHTLSDQVETILYRLASSPGRRALRGMEAQSGLLVRPLLAAGVTREETAAWCLRRGRAWREDASNADPAYARTRVREVLAPALRATDPRAERNLLRTAQLLREEGEVLDELVEAQLEGGDAIPVARLAALPPALARLVLRRMAEEATGGLCAAAGGRVADVLGLGDGGPGGRALDLGGGARALVRGGVLRVGRTPALPVA